MLLLCSISLSRALVVKHKVSNIARVLDERRCPKMSSSFYPPLMVRSFVSGVLAASLGKMMEEIETNLPRFDQCIR